MKIKLPLLLIVFVNVHTLIKAQSPGPIQTDRPDQTETPYTVPVNHFQMETGLSFEQTDPDVQSFSDPSILFKYGLNDHFELGIITEFATLKTKETISGLTPITLRFKEKITDEKGLLPITSFIGYLSVPNWASKEFKSTYFAPAFRFTMQHTLSQKFTLSYNLGAEWNGETPEPAFIYTLTTGYSISDKFGAYVEVYGFAPQSSKADHRFDGGLNFLLKENILLDISGGAGITENAPDYYMALGFSFRLKD